MRDILEKFVSLCEDLNSNDVDQLLPKININFQNAKQILELLEPSDEAIQSVYAQGFENARNSNDWFNSNQEIPDGKHGMIIEVVTVGTRHTGTCMLQYLDKTQCEIGTWQSLFESTKEYKIDSDLWRHVNFLPQPLRDVCVPVCIEAFDGYQASLNQE